MEKVARIEIPEGYAPIWARRRAAEVFAKADNRDGEGYGHLLAAWVENIAAHLIAMLETPPVDPVREKARNMWNGMSIGKDAMGSVDLIEAGLRAGIEMARKEAQADD